MDGLKIKLSRSIQFRLSLWLSLTILAVAVGVGAFGFMKTLRDVNALQDETLRQVATLIEKYELPLPPEGEFLKARGPDGRSRVLVQQLIAKPVATPVPTPALTPLVEAGESKVNSERGKRQGAEQRKKVRPPAALALTMDLPDGFLVQHVGDDVFRVLVQTLPTGQRFAVAQRVDFRDEIAQRNASHALIPFLLLVPILLLLVAHLVRRIFKPVAELSREIDLRSEQDLHQIPAESLPVEIRSFVEAINRLLGRVKQSMDEQRRFVADAAHELRSPLTAMSLQAERLADAEMSVTAEERLVTLRNGIERGRLLLDQLLMLARVQSSSVTPATAISVQSVFRHVLEVLMPLAELKNIDIGVVGDEDATVRADEVELTTLIKNLVDNAIRYTPAGGCVDLSVTKNAEGVVVEVTDNGPGIPEAERERVMDPFYRILGSNEIGSGLGLSIVKAIACRIGATIQLQAANEMAQSGPQSGLKVRVIFPISAV